jgi:hypothetical protein
LKGIALCHFPIFPVDLIIFEATIPFLEKDFVLHIKSVASTGDMTCLDCDGRRESKCQ